MRRPRRVRTLCCCTCRTGGDGTLCYDWLLLLGGKFPNTCTESLVRSATTKEERKRGGMCCRVSGVSYMQHVVWCSNNLSISSIASYILHAEHAFLSWVIYLSSCFRSFWSAGVEFMCGFRCEWCFSFQGGKQSGHLWWGGWAVDGIYDSGCGWENGPLRKKECGDCVARFGRKGNGVAASNKRALWLGWDGAARSLRQRSEGMAGRPPSQTTNTWWVVIKRSADH